MKKLEELNIQCYDFNDVIWTFRHELSEDIEEILQDEDHTIDDFVVYIHKSVLVGNRAIFETSDIDVFCPPWVTNLINKMNDEFGDNTLYYIGKA